MSFINVLTEEWFNLLGTLLFALVSFLFPIIKDWVKAKKDNSQLGIFNAVADQAVELIEREFSGENGDIKFNRAADYVAQMLKEGYNINVTGEFVKGAVQSGWRRMDEKQKGAGING